MDKDAVLYEQCDVLVPAAIGNVITSDNASKLNCQFVVEAANGPTTPNVRMSHPIAYALLLVYICRLIAVVPTAVQYILIVEEVLSAFGIAPCNTSAFVNIQQIVADSCTWL